MRIADLIDILKAQVTFKRTPMGRSIVDEAIDNIRASLDDKKNWNSGAVRCKNCGIILSGLLVPEGCVNCGSKDLSDNISKIRS